MQAKDNGDWESGKETKGVKLGWSEKLKGDPCRT
jgi:hypothetical protein